MNAHSEEARLGIGGNNPPEITLADQLREKHAPALAKLDTLAERANKAPKEITSDEDVAALSDIAADARDERKTLDAIRTAEKDPFLKGGREVDGFFRDPIERATRIETVLTQRVTDYRREQKRKADEARAKHEREEREAAEEARRQAEKAMKSGRTEDAMAALEDAQHSEETAQTIAEAEPIKPELVRTAAGVTAGTKTEWKFEIVDFEAIPLNTLRHLIKRDAIDAALRQFVKNGNREIAGVRIFEDIKADIRRR